MNTHTFTAMWVVVAFRNVNVLFHEDFIVKFKYLELLTIQYIFDS